MSRKYHHFPGLKIFVFGFPVTPVLTLYKLWLEFVRTTYLVDGKNLL